MAAVTDVLDVAPSLRDPADVRVVDHDAALEGVDAVSVPVTSTGEVPEVLGVDLDGLARAGFRPTVGYGMTELPGITFNVGSAKPGSVGRVIPGVEARILGPEGRELPTGEVGEVVLKAPWMSSAYYRQSDDSATKMRDGWLYTGDLGYFDADKYLFLVGRSKEVIIQGGNKVSPQEVADAIAVRGHLEGMAARLVAEHGVTRQLAHELQLCLAEGDAALAAKALKVEHYARYATMNDRFHSLILGASGNLALQRAIVLNNRLPFAPASAMLPMQGTLAEDRDWMLYAHRQHHMLVDALQQGNGARAAALAVEHTEVAQYNLRQALLKRNESEKVLPAMRLVVGR